MKQNAARTGASHHTTVHGAVRPIVGIEAIAAVGALLLLLGLVLQILTVLLHTGGVPGEGVFDPDGEANVWAWYSALVISLLALSFAVHALVRRGEGRAWLPYALLGTVVLYMSVDEAASLHERLGALGPSGLSYPWLVVGIPLAVVVGIVVLRVARGIEPTMRRRLIVAGVVYLTGAAGMEALQEVFFDLSGETHTTLVNVLLKVVVAVEEGLEVTGVLLGMRAVWGALLVRNGPGGLTVRSNDGADASH